MFKSRIRSGRSGNKTLFRPNSSEFTANVNKTYCFTNMRPVTELMIYHWFLYDNGLIYIVKETVFFRPGAEQQVNRYLWKLVKPTFHVLYVNRFMYKIYHFFGHHSHVWKRAKINQIKKISWNIKSRDSVLMSILEKPNMLFKKKIETLLNICECHPTMIFFLFCSNI